MKFGTEKIRGIEYEIEVDGSGMFFCTVDEIYLSAPSLEALKRKISEQTKAMAGTISIPYVYWDDSSWEDKPRIAKGVCVGIHA